MVCLIWVCSVLLCWVRFVSVVFVIGCSVLLMVVVLVLVFLCSDCCSDRVSCFCRVWFWVRNLVWLDSRCLFVVVLCFLKVCVIVCRWLISVGSVVDCVCSRCSDLVCC